MLLKRVQLGLIHAAVAMTLVPINSTLNRVMIKELALSASLVAFLASLPYLISPIQVAIGSFSDRHPFLGWRRTPYIALGLLLCTLGVVFSPMAALVMAESRGVGLVFGLLAFGAWGMGFNFASVSYFSLASQLFGEKGRGKTIAVMFFLMIVSIILTAMVLSRLVDPYTTQAMQHAFFLVGVVALGLGLLGLIGLEPRFAALVVDETRHSWGRLVRAVLENRQATLFFFYLVVLLVALLGQDVLLEPFGAEAFHMPVKSTTRITSLWGGCFLLSLMLAGVLESRFSKRMVAFWGGWGALVGFVLILSSGLVLQIGVFYGGVILLGLGTGLSTVANLSLMLDMTTPQNVGLYIGAWGMANAVSRLIGSLMGGAMRDLMTQILYSPVLAYVVVFGLEALMLLISLFLLRQIDVSAFRRQSEALSVVERASLAGEA